MARSLASLQYPKARERRGSISFSCFPDGWQEASALSFFGTHTPCCPRPIRLYTFQTHSLARRFYERHGYKAIEFTDGQGNEEKCPDVLYELGAPATSA